MDGHPTITFKPPMCTNATMMPTFRRSPHSFFRPVLEVPATHISLGGAPAVSAPVSFVPNGRKRQVEGKDRAWSARQPPAPLESYQLFGSRGGTFSGDTNEKRSPPASRIDTSKANMSVR